MAGDPEVAIENIVLRTVDVKTLRKDIAERLRLFSFFDIYQFYNYIGSQGEEGIVENILELKSESSLVLSYEGSQYGYEPMAKRTFKVYVALRNTKNYVKDFDTDPLSDAVEAVILALDKWMPRDHCRLMVVRDDTMDVSQTMSAASVTLEAEDQ